MHFQERFTIRVADFDMATSTLTIFSDHIDGAPVDTVLDLLFCKGEAVLAW
jgi:hypothetical protein